MPRLVAALFLWSLAMPAARADAPRIVSYAECARGNCKPAQPPAAVTNAAAAITTKLDVCWIAARPPAVSIALTVAANGQVTSAAAQTKHAVAQCVAGIFAVQTLASRSAPYNLTIELATESKLSPDDILAKLSTHRPTLDACYEKARKATPALRRNVALKFRIAATGEISEPAIAQASAKHDAMDQCLLAAARTIRLQPAPGKAVVFTLSLSYAPPVAATTPVAASTSSAPNASASTAANGSLQPGEITTHGPLDAQDIASDLAARSAAIMACYGKHGKPATGNIVVQLKITSKGSVDDVKFRDPGFASSAMQTCVSEALRAATFVKDPGGNSTRVIYPLGFSAR